MEHQILFQYSKTNSNDKYYRPGDSAQLTHQALTATPTGGTWSGTGISADRTLIRVLQIGPNTITYTVTQDGCTEKKALL